MLAGVPAARWRTVTIMARVMLDSGAKVVAEVPLIIPFSRHQPTASAYHAPAGTSVKLASGCGETVSSFAAFALGAEIPEAAKHTPHSRVTDSAAAKIRFQCFMVASSINRY